MNRLLPFGLIASLLLGTQGCNGGAKKDAEASANGSQSDTGNQQATKNGGNSASGESSKSSSMPADSVRIDSANQKKASIRLDTVQSRTVPQQLTVAGQVMMDEKRTDHIGALADGKIEKVFVLPGDQVRAGQTLAWLHSHTVHETVGALTQAFAAVTRQQAAVSFAERNNDRYQHLYAIQAASQEEAQRAAQGLQQAHQDLANAEANVHMEREHLSELLQVPPTSLTPDNLYNRELVPIRAVGAGTVITRNVTPGQVVTTGNDAFVISNLTSVWVIASVNEKDLAKVHRGETAGIATQAYQGEVFRGTVTMLGDQLDPQTRTLPVRLEVPNPDMRLRPGMFATASINEPHSRMAVFVPENALQDMNGIQVVFVTVDGTTFQVRAVKLGVRSNGWVEVTDGLKPGDRIVVDGAFMVKGELLKGTVGEG